MILVILYYMSNNFNAFVVKDSKVEIKIGAIVPLTGTYTTLGNRIKNGMELAKYDIEKDDNITIKTYYEDVCAGKDAMNAIDKLINVDKIDILGASFCVVGLIPNVPILQKEKITSFTMTVTPDSLLNQPYVFTTNKAIKDDARDLANFARNKLHAKTAATAYFSTDLGIDYNKYFKQNFENSGGKVVSENMYELTDNDFRTELTKIKAANPDVIFVINLGANMGNFLKQAREMGINSTIISYVQTEDPNVLTAAGNAAEGFIISSSETQEKSNQTLDFQKRYKERFGSDPDVMAAISYDAMKLETFAYQKCNGDKDCIIKELHKIKNYEGVSGNITIQKDGSTTKPTIFKIVKNGKFVLYDG